MTRLIAISCLFTSSIVAAEPARLVPDPRLDAAAPLTGAVCAGGEIRCHAHAVIHAAGDVRAFAAPAGWSALDLQSAYGVAPGTEQQATIAIVDAYGYPTLESDLAAYRAQFGLAPCTQANGCLRIVNQNGQPSPLPAPPPQAGFDWTMETALDVQMASAICPGCKILVVQSDDNSFDSMYPALYQALAMHPTVVSNSWGATEAQVNIPYIEGQLAQHPGIAVFASTGDLGYQSGGDGPQYPSTSPRIVAVGGTVLAKAGTGRGWSETAWNGAGSSCSDSLPRIASQPQSACTRRAASDVSAVAGGGGVAVYHVASGGWITVLGTSAACPIVATLFAAHGLGSITPDRIAALAPTFHDVTSGINGTCGTSLCNAGAGWDGPTGFGTPDAARLRPATLAIASPQADAVVPPGFTVSLAIAGDAEVTVAFDDRIIGTTKVAPYDFPTPMTTTAGPHTITITGQDILGNPLNASIEVIVSSTDGSHDPGSSELSSGCAAAGGSSALPLLVLGYLARRRRR